MRRTRDDIWTEGPGGVGADCQGLSARPKRLNVLSLIRAGETKAPPAGGAQIQAGGLSGAGSHLVEAVGAVDRTVVARQERHERLAAALRAHGGMHLPLAPVPVSAPDPEGPVLLGDGTTALASLRLIDESLAGIELLFTG